MAKNKTTPNEVSVEEFIHTLEDERKREDSLTIIEMMKQVSGCEPKMWGGNIIGFGSYHYRYASGHEGDTMRAGFAPRKPHLVIYNMGSIDPDDALLKNLGKYKREGGCLYIKRLTDVDTATLQRLIEVSFGNIQAQYPIE